MTDSIVRESHGTLPDQPSLALPGIEDHYRWALEQAAHIRAGRFDLVDILNVADEIEDVGKNELRSLRSNIEIVLLHMLKWQFQPERRTRSWEGSIGEHRRRILADLRDSPSLKSKTAEAVEHAYELARYRAVTETNLSLHVFPADCPYDWDQIMAAPYTLDRD